jgi:YD repeat-containing protein
MAAEPVGGTKMSSCYDLVGNRTKAYLKSDTATTYLHDPVNELTRVDNTAYEYAAAGNLTKDGTYAYSWDYENRLTKVKLASDGSDVAEYTYDALGRRVEKLDQTGETDVTTRWYLDRWSVVEERDGDGGPRLRWQGSAGARQVQGMHTKHKSG